MTFDLPAGEIWIIAGLVGCGLEMLAPGVFLLPTGVAAVGAGVLTLAVGLGLTGQVLAFLGLTVALVGLTALRMRRRAAPPDQVNAPSAGLIGQSCRSLGFEAGEGRVSLGDGTWAARMVEDSTPEAGTVLRVVGLDGTVLLVHGRIDGAWRPK